MRGSTAPPGGRGCWGTVYQGPRSLATVVRPAGGPLRLGWTSSARKHSSAGRFSGRASGSLRPAGRPGLARRLRAPGSRRDPTPFFLRSFSARQGARALPGASSPWKAEGPNPFFPLLFFCPAGRTGVARGFKPLEGESATPNLSLFLRRPEGGRSSRIEGPRPPSGRGEGNGL
jgi:hypothetical protein